MPRLVLAALLSCSAFAAAQDPGTSYIFRVDLTADRNAWRKLAPFDVMGACCAGHERVRGAATADVVVGPEELRAFRRLGLRHTLVERGRPFHEVAEERRKAAPLAPPDANYFTVAEIEAELLKLQRAHPRLAARIDITALTKTAKTHEGRNLGALKISDNVATDEDEPQVLIASQHHARELNTPYMVIQAARRILAGYATDPFLRRVVDGTELWLVPCVNPDGVNYVWTRDRWWRKNRRNNGGGIFGVDLNRNYPFRYGLCGASSSTRSQTYKGPGPGSEPETKTMMALARMRRFERYLDFHSYGQEVLQTYSPCTVNQYGGSNVLAMHTRFRAELARALGYRVRNPSASGEAMEWHWAENGSLSYLVEVGRSFQPAWSETVREEVAVWKGVKKFLEFTPAFRGQVRSLRGGRPLDASLDAKTLGHRFGELARAGGKFGRLHLWLPPGASDVVVGAAGHDGQRLRVTAPAYDTTRRLDVTLIPTLPAATLAGAPTAKLGGVATITFRANDPNKRYWVPMALGTSPGFAIGPRRLPLNPDVLFFLSTGDLSPVYTGQLGMLDARGEARVRLAFPAVPILAGFKLYLAGMTFEQGWPFDVKAFSRAFTVTLVR